MPGTRYTHTNVIARDWRALAGFYIDVFGCEPVGPERDLEGAWVDALTGLLGAHVKGAHLRLPGHGPDGPTLEVFAYGPAAPGEVGPVNRPGFAHIAFHVDDVAETLASVTAHGGSALGEVVQRDYPELGRLTAVYARDPEGNILELQNWAR
jgi:predicted enzyme related to lactoylglutathione lyase